MRDKNLTYVAYEQFDQSSMGLGLDHVCNGCGFIAPEWQQHKHIQECTITQLRLVIDRKSNGKTKFTKTR